MHISLDSALGRQRRLNSVGESVLQIAPNAAAAYSLRSLTGGDPRVVRVRRASDNGERDFTSSEIATGEMVSWVNQQVIAPLDIQALEADGRTGDFLIAKAAYALRSLGTRQATLAATGDTVARANGKFVVQVRRSSDDALKSFTADEITDGTLLAFVNEIQTVGTAINGTAPLANYTVSNLSTTGFSADNSAGGTGSAGFPYVFKDDDVLVVKYTVTNFSSTSGLSPIIRGVNATNSAVGKTNGGTTITANGTYTDTLTATADGTHLMFADGNTGSYTISNFEIVSHSSNGFVKTWYDQSVTNEAGDTATGNHAVQATAASQPKIVNAGSLLTDGIDFDGTDQVGLVTGSFSLTQAFTTFSVSHTDDASTSLGIWATAASATSNFNTASFFRNDDGLAVNAGTTLTTAGTIDYVADRTYLQTNVVNGGSSSIFVDGATGATGNAGSTNPSGVLIIGYFKSGGYINLDGAIKELIIYDSDQTANRTAIEANIGEAYSITGIPAYDDEVDGFVETWYDQSGNSNDVTQATAGSQPKIVNAGSLVTVGSRASFKFDGSSDFLERETYTQGSLSQPNTFFSVAELDAYADENRKVYDSHVSTARNMLQLNTAGNGQFAHFAGTVAATGEDADADRHLFTSLMNGASSDLRIDGTSKTTANTASQAMTGIVIGANHNTAENFWDGDIQEIIIYNSNQSSTTTAVETNINSHYSIF